MNPATIPNDGPNRALLDTVDLGQPPVCFSGLGMSLTDLIGEREVQFCSGTAVQVFSVNDSFEVIWIHARRDAAEMVKSQAVRDRAKLANIRLPMRESTPTASSAVRKDSVSEPVMGALENPAGSLITAIFDRPKVRPPCQSHTAAASVAFAKAIANWFTTSALTQLRRLVHVGLLYRLTSGAAPLVSSPDPIIRSVG